MTTPAPAPPEGVVSVITYLTLTIQPCPGCSRFHSHWQLESIDQNISDVGQVGKQLTGDKDPNDPQDEQVVKSAWLHTQSSWATATAWFGCSTGPPPSSHYTQEENRTVDWSTSDSGLWEKTLLNGYFVRRCCNRKIRIKNDSIFSCVM